MPVQMCSTSLNICDPRGTAAVLQTPAAGEWSHWQRGVTELELLLVLPYGLNLCRRFGRAITACQSWRLELLQVPQLLFPSWLCTQKSPYKGNPSLVVPTRHWGQLRSGREQPSAGAPALDKRCHPANSRVIGGQRKEQIFVIRAAANLLVPC